MNPASVGSMAPHAAIGSEPVRKTVTQIDADLRDWSQLQPTRTACAFCDWSFEGTAIDGRAAFLEHRESAHPEMKVSRKRKRPQVKGVVAMAPVKDDLAQRHGRARAAEIAALHERRATEEQDSLGRAHEEAPPAESAASAEPQADPLAWIAEARAEAGLEEAA